MHMDTFGIIRMHNIDAYGYMTDAYGCMRMHTDACNAGLGLPQQAPGLAHSRKTDLQDLSNGINCIRVLCLSFAKTSFSIGVCLVC